jgi:hypothetical protein
MSAGQNSMNFALIRIRCFVASPLLTATIGPVRTRARKEVDISSSAPQRSYRLSESGRRRLSDIMKRRHADPEFRAKKISGASKNMKRLHADPEFAARAAARASARMKRLNADPEFRAKKLRGERRRTANNWAKTLSACFTFLPEIFPDFDPIIFRNGYIWRSN